MNQQSLEIIENMNTSADDQIYIQETKSFDLFNHINPKSYANSRKVRLKVQYNS